MAVVDNAAAPASHPTKIGGYGSRIALAVLACPGRRERLGRVLTQHSRHVDAAEAVPDRDVRFSG
jgi:hypothetical protein